MPVRHGRPLVWFSLVSWCLAPMHPQSHSQHLWTEYLCRGFRNHLYQGSIMSASNLSAQIEIWNSMSLIMIESSMAWAMNIHLSNGIRQNCRQRSASRRAISHPEGLLVNSFSFSMGIPIIMIKTAFIVRFSSVGLNEDKAQDPIANPSKRSEIMWET